MTTADGARFVFASAGPLTLLAVSRAGDGEGALRAALAALHGALTLTLTGPVIERTAGRSGGDLRPALAGSRPTLLAVLRACNRSPAPWLGPSLPVLSIGGGARGRLASLLGAGVAHCPGTVYALLVAGHALAGWAQRRDYALHPADGFLLAALVQSGSAFRRSRASWTPVCLPGLNPDGYLQTWVTLLAEVPPRAPGRDAGYNGDPPAGDGGGGGGGEATPAASPTSSLPTPSATPTAGGAGSGGTYHPDASPPGVFLVLVSQATDPAAVQALSDASDTIAQQLGDSGVLDAVTSTLAAAGGAGCGDFPASRYREPGCLHFVHAWRPLGQHTQSLLPPVVGCHAQRKALLRGYAHVYDRLLAGAVTDAAGDDAPGAPPSLRHYVASFPALAAAGAAVAAAAASDGGGSPPPPGVATLAGLRTTHGTLLAAWDASVAHADVPAAMERLAKALRADNDKLLAPHPGVITSGS